ncbi:MAG TPA: polyketide synthase, partial [Flavitalea sp.]|nr:polyketide synthase [Flavitalea sp.]
QDVPVARKNTILGIAQNFIAAHASHFFNFKGPNMVVDTACSSSLSSLHLACQSLLLGESEIALAGGVDLLLNEKYYKILSEMGALSPDGKCHTFDEKANGFVPGEGCGVVLIKTLQRAIADGDQIYAVIEGSALNNDGYTMGVTTPNPEAQQAVIGEALMRARVEPDTIEYVEAHGTGTGIGDPIELKALTQCFQKNNEDFGYCGVGSVKTNIGHLLSAAGIASVIKVALSIYHQQLFPTLNCDTPNPRFQFDKSPFYVVNEQKNWIPRKGIRRAGISSFGLGGTNLHVIMGELEPDVAKTTMVQRKPLPPVVFHKKRFWIDDLFPKRSIEKPLDQTSAQVSDRDYTNGNAKGRGSMLAIKLLENFPASQENMPVVF